MGFGHECSSGISGQAHANVLPIRGRAPFPGQLVRPRYPRMIGGVCAGFAQHYGWDLSLVRVVTALMIVCTGVGLIAYIAAWIIIPEAPYILPESTYPGSAGPVV